MNTEQERPELNPQDTDPIDVNPSDETLPEAEDVPSEENLAPDDGSALEDDQPSEAKTSLETEKQESLPEEEPWEESERSSSHLDDEFDVDAALASIATLSALGINDEDEADEFENDDDFEDEYYDGEEADSLETEETAISDISRPHVAQQVNAPPIYDFSRGQLASIIPALALMLYGAWLTFALSSDAAPTLAEALTLAVVATGASFLSYWLSSGRTANGAGMLGLSLMIVPGMLYFLSTDDTSGAEAWPLLVVGIGVALLLSGILSRGITAKGGFTGLLLMFMGGVAYALTSDRVEFDVEQSAEILLPVLGLVVIVLLIAPLLPRRR